MRYLAILPSFLVLVGCGGSSGSVSDVRTSPQEDAGTADPGNTLRHDSGSESASGSGSGSTLGSGSGSDAASASCTFHGATVASGDTVSPSPYASATVPAGSQCVTETVTCQNGALSPANASPTCSVSSMPTGPVKYLSALGAKCDGSDDTLAVIAAVTGARNNAYTLMVDCVATLDIGVNIDRSIFIDNDTTIQFESTGKFIVNNLFEPAFVIADTTNVTLLDWNVEYNASMPVSLNTDGYSLAGVYYSTPGENGSGYFSDKILTGWLEQNRGVDFVDGPTHGIWAYFLGSVNISSIFFIVGSTSNVTVTGLNLVSANTNQPSDYIPFGFMLGLNFKPNQSVTTATPKVTDTNASVAFAAPSHLAFDHVTLDGIIMGFQGNTIDSTFSNITVMHVSDLQDDNGDNIGGVGQNFPPPHLFYLNYQFEGDPALANSGITISNVNEVGPRLGGVRPGGGGYANSLKLGCNDCSVNGYNTNRKDGFMDVLNSNGLTVSNVVASYDSSFVDEYEKWPALRWPGGGDPTVFENITFENITLTDVAAQTVSGPVGNNTATGNANLSLTDFNVIIQSWPDGSIVPGFTGLTANSLVTFTLKAQNTSQYLRP